MELRVLHSATPRLRQREWEKEKKKEWEWGEILQKILLPFCHESLLVANDTILIPLNH